MRWGILLQISTGSSVFTVEYQGEAPPWMSQKNWSILRVALFSFKEVTHPLFWCIVICYAVIHWLKIDLSEMTGPLPPLIRSVPDFHEQECIALLKCVRPLSEWELLAEVSRMEEAYSPLWIWVSLEQDLPCLCISEQTFWAGKAYKKAWLKHGG